jgi:hypothetical protein
MFGGAVAVSKRIVWFRFFVDQCHDSKDIFIEYAVVPGFQFLRGLVKVHRDLIEGIRVLYYNMFLRYTVE